LDVYGYCDRQSGDEGIGTLKRLGRREAPWEQWNGIYSDGTKKRRVQTTVVDAAMTIVVVKSEP